MNLKNTSYTLTTINEETTALINLTDETVIELNTDALIQYIIAAGKKVEPKVEEVVEEPKVEEVPADGVKRVGAIEQFLKEYRTKSLAFLLTVKQSYNELMATDSSLLAPTLRADQLEKTLGWPEANPNIPNQPSRQSWTKYYAKVNFRQNSKWHNLATEYNTEESGDKRFQDRVEELLDKDIKAKRKALIARVEKLVGEITDASALRVGYTGEIEGIITGTTGSCKLETITAGGYNIQCFHFRTLVKALKK